MPKFKNMVANATPSATLLLGDKIKEEIRTLYKKPVSITPSSSNARQQPFYTDGVKGGGGGGGGGGGAEVGCKSLQQIQRHPHSRNNSKQRKWLDRQASQQALKSIQGKSTYKK